MYADAHADLFYEVALSGADLFSGAHTLHITYQAMKAVNQRLQVCSLWTPPSYQGEKADHFGQKLLTAFENCIDQHPQEFILPTQRHEIQRIYSGEDPRIAFIPWLEGASPLQGLLPRLSFYASRGVKGIGLVWNHSNEVTDGCGIAEPRRGLTAFGHELIHEMEAQRLIVDLAHCPEPAFFDVAKIARAPLVVTHTGMRSLVPITRNISDTMGRTIAESGGFVGIDFYPGHVYRYAFHPCARQAQLSDLCDHIRHAIHVCGSDNVVLGSDFDGFRDPIQGLEHLDKIPNLREELKKHGLKERIIDKIFFENLFTKLIELW